MTRLTARRRIVLGIVASWPIAYFYLDWSVFTGLNIVRYYRGGYTNCDGSWRSYTNSCDGSFSATLAWAELLLVSALALTLAFLVARWAIRPVREMAATLTRMGPTSLGLRMPADGPGDETRELAEGINAMLDRVGEGYLAQRRFAANASHELRTPLATQRALIEVSLSRALTPEQLELLSRQLLATNERNERLIEGLLVLAETEQGIMSSSPQRLDAIVGSTVALLGPYADDRGVTVTTELAQVEVPGETPLLERLVTNLVQNAIKYNAPGGWVRVSLDRDALTVANSGPMIAQQHVDGLFEAFRRASGDRLEHGGGVGLGLTIARSVVAAHHGSIAATANPDGGLTMVVRLPAAV